MEIAKSDVSDTKLTEQEIQRSCFGHNVHEVEKDYRFPVADRPSPAAFPGGCEVDSRDVQRDAEKR